MQNNVRTIDLIIITWNCLEYLKVCLESIRDYTKNVPYRIFVVNNGSSDGTKEYLEKIKSIKIINNRKNLGFPKALLQGYQQTTSEFVCIMNDDIVVSPNWLWEMQKVLTNNTNIGLLGPCRPGAHFLHPYTNQLSKATLEESKKLYKSPKEQLDFFTFHKDYETFTEDYKKKNPPELIIYNSLPNIISTCCALVRRLAVEKAGGIVDTRFQMYGGEDVDLSWRLIKTGFDLGITSKSYAHHFEHISISKVSFDRQKYLNINVNKLYKKWVAGITACIQGQLDAGLDKEQILQKSWLLKRISDAVGPKIWENVMISKSH